VRNDSCRLRACGGPLSLSVPCRADRPLLVVDLWLILQLLVSRGGPASPENGGLGPWLSRIVDWLGDERRCLVALVVASWVLSLLEACSLLWLQRLVNRYALDVSLAMRRAIHDQAFVLGPQDLLGATAGPARRELFAEKVETVRYGLALWWLGHPTQLDRIVAADAPGHARLTSGSRCWPSCWTWYVIRRFHLALKRRAEAKLRTYRDNRKSAGRHCWRKRFGLAPLATGYSLESPQRIVDAELKELSGRASWLSPPTRRELPLLLFIVLFAVFLSCCCSWACRRR